MNNPVVKALSAAGIIMFLYSCSAKKITSDYYYQHQPVLEEMEQSYKKLYAQKPFTLAFTDKEFRTVSLEIITDTLSYIYDFGVHEPRLNDTLRKYNMNVEGVNHLVNLMVGIRCTWIDNFDYYVDEQRRTLILISIKPVALRPILSYKKYYILTFFSQPQHFDAQGRLLDKRRLRRLRKINGEVFQRINDKVCYTISGQFR
jgi:hypothetical protein